MKGVQGGFLGEWEKVLLFGVGGRMQCFFSVLERFLDYLAGLPRGAVGQG
jgi:hypothetical protein